MTQMVAGLLLVAVVAALGSGQPLLESDNEVVYRVPRNAHPSGGVAGRPKGNNGECRYKKSNWEECDPTTNLERRTLTLKKGGASCEPVKILTRKCKKACRYEKGEWEECNAETNMRSRTDTLKPKSDASCQPTRVITKKCKKACKYDRQADWSRCENGKKTKVMELVQGNPATCEPNRTVTKPCRVGGGGGHHRRGQTPQGPKHIPSEEDYEDEER